ncbi:hypothetical protein LXL04_024746 [Taraxacum kok-saghyz]
MDLPENNDFEVLKTTENIDYNESFNNPISEKGETKSDVGDENESDEEEVTNNEEKVTTNVIDPGGIVRKCKGCEEYVGHNWRTCEVRIARDEANKATIRLVECVPEIDCSASGSGSLGGNKRTLHIRDIPAPLTPHKIKDIPAPLTRENRASKSTVNSRDEIDFRNLIYTCNLPPKMKNSSSNSRTALFYLAPHILPPPPTPPISFPDELKIFPFSEEPLPLSQTQTTHLNLNPISEPPILNPKSPSSFSQTPTFTSPLYGNVGYALTSFTNSIMICRQRECELIRPYYDCLTHDTLGVLEHANYLVIGAFTQALLPGTRSKKMQGWVPRTRDKLKFRVENTTTTGRRRNQRG